MAMQAIRNIPNIISLSRIPVLFMIVGLLYLPIRGAATLALILFILGAATDWLDGFLARKYNIVSNFGKMIDALTDKIFIIGLFVTLLALNFLPEVSIFLILLIIGREFMVTGLRLVAASKGLVLAAERMGKIKTLTQIFTIGICLFNNMIIDDFPNFIQPWMESWNEVLEVSFLILATYLTVHSGINYIIKYWDIFTEEERL